MMPTLVPPGATDALADQLASYLGGSYEIIDRGEVCWYMGKLGMTMREVLNDPVALGGERRLFDPQRLASRALPYRRRRRRQWSAVPRQRAARG